MIVYSNKFEWEFLQENLDLLSKDYIIKTNLDISSLKSCHLKRYENYSIFLEINGILNNVLLRELRETNELINFIFENNDEVILLNFCVFDSQTFSFNNETGATQITYFKVNNVEISYKNNSNRVHCIKEFYLNSVWDKLIFSRPTKYFNEGKYLKVRSWEEDNE